MHWFLFIFHHRDQLSDPPSDIPSSLSLESNPPVKIYDTKRYWLLKLPYTDISHLSQVVALIRRHAIAWVRAHSCVCSFDRVILWRGRFGRGCRRCSILKLLVAVRFRLFGGAIGSTWACSYLLNIYRVIILSNYSFAQNIWPWILNKNK